MTFYWLLQDVRIVRIRTNYIILIAVISMSDVLLKLFMINLDDNEEDIDISQPVEVEIEENKLIEDLNDLLFEKDDISRESVLHFVIQNNSKPLILDNYVQCSTLASNYVSIMKPLYFVLLYTLFNLYSIDFHIH